MDDLKLIALDAEDLAVISAHLQDAVLTVGDMAFLPNEKRFAALANRFNWMAHDERRRSALRFERVLGAKVQGIDLASKSTVLNLLAIAFERGEEPAGRVELVFAGGGAVRLEVECIEAELRDLGPVWRAARQPQHPEKDGSGEQDS